jgi:hypothetical protein
LYKTNFGTIAWLLTIVFPGMYCILIEAAVAFVGVDAGVAVLVAVEGTEVAVLVAVEGTGLAVRVAVTVAGIDVAVRVAVLIGVFVLVWDEVEATEVEVAGNCPEEGSTPHTRTPFR